MAQIQLITVQNLTAHIQKCFWNGSIYALNPYQVREFPEDVAYAFLEQRSKFVIEYKPVELPEPLPGERLVWVANNTGNPFLPATIKLKRYRKGEEEEYEIPNPLREPVVVRRQMQRGQIIRPQDKDPTASESLNLGTRTIAIPPFTRVCVSQGLANWLLRRDMMQERQHRGRIVTCRPPTDCDPNVTWSLEELQVLAKIMEIGDEHMGQHEAEIRASFVDEEVAEVELLKAKQDMLYVLFFRLIDDRYWQPSKSEFDAFMKEARSVALKEEPLIPEVSDKAVVQGTETEQEPRRRRGRPPKRTAEAEAGA